MIQQFVPVRNTFGEDEESWVDLATVWAKVGTVKGTEQFKSDQRLGIKDASFRIRYRDDVDITMRIFYNDDYYEIKSINEIGRQEGLEIVAVANNPVSV